MFDSSLDSKLCQESPRGIDLALENSPACDQNEMVEGDRHNLSNQLYATSLSRLVIFTKISFSNFVYLD